MATLTGERPSGRRPFLLDVQAAHFVFGRVAGVLSLDIAEAVGDGDAEFAGLIFRVVASHDVVHPYS